MKLKDLSLMPELYHGIADHNGIGTKYTADKLAACGKADAHPRLSSNLIFRAQHDNVA